MATLADYRLKQLEIAIDLAKLSLQLDPPTRDAGTEPTGTFLEALEDRIHQCLPIVEKAIRLDEMTG